MTKNEKGKGKRKAIVLIAIFVVIMVAAGMAYAVLGTGAQNTTEMQGNSVATESDGGSSSGSGNSVSSSGTTAVSLPNTREQREAAPDFTVTDESGSSVTLSSFKGKPTVVMFWASWCPTCQKELDALNTGTYEKYADRVNFVPIDSVDGSKETMATGQAYADKKGLIFPIYFDSESQNAAITYGVSSIPRTFFIDADGGLIGYYPGYLDDSLMNGYLEAILAEK